MNDLWYHYFIPTIAFISALFAAFAVAVAIVAAVKFTKNEMLLMFAVRVGIIVLPMILSFLATVFFALGVQVCVSLFWDACFLFYNSPTLTTAMIFSGTCSCILLIELILLLCTKDKYATEESGTQTHTANNPDESEDKPLSAILVNPHFKQAFIARRPPIQTDL